MRKDIDLAEVLEKTGSDEWNTAISSRLEPMRSFFLGEQWQKGINPFLRAVLGNGLRKFLREGGNADYLRGFIAALEMVLALPASVEAQIQREAGKKKTGTPRGDAGY
jgi:hypothetical protein